MLWCVWSSLTDLSRVLALQCIEGRSTANDDGGHHPGAASAVVVVLAAMRPVSWPRGYGVALKELLLWNGWNWSRDPLSRTLVPVVDESRVTVLTAMEDTVLLVAM
ncbi:hypothetical protein QFZ23_000941 [Arthrobacter globiformis]|nr:hypothetical protein [Arthrobacter globiformis]